MELQMSPQDQAEQMTRIIVEDMVSELCSMNNPPANGIVVIIRKIISDPSKDEFSGDVELIHPLIKDISDKTDDDAFEVFAASIRNMDGEGWERVISILSQFDVFARYFFAARFGGPCATARASLLDDFISRHNITEIIVREVTPGIVRQGGWDDFVRYNNRDEMEEDKKTTWPLIASLLGIAAFGIWAAYALITHEKTIEIHRPASN